MHGNLPFLPGEYRESTGDNAIDLDARLGEEFHYPSPGNPMRTYRLVKTHASAFAWAKKLAIWSSDSTHVITPCTTAGQVAAGIVDDQIPAATSVPAAAYVLAHILGRCTGVQGNDTGAYCTDGEYATADDDTDTGKLKGTATWAHRDTFAVVIGATATVVDQDVSLEIVDKLGAAA